ncbi:unnamed protein product [Echinostoma caproni]|uniref:N(6)-adenosine-methyltransferase non-catalytic subunit METTL14 n=1 Tax=Echinostoma caproni TaxID=27848 RepID=A0A183BBI9_9TREM|nr:unnamed protein product [Echinostoma caproni]
MCIPESPHSQLLCLRKWGFRRCEDICWIKTNRGRPGHEALEPGAVFQRTKEHCLMGIHGTVRRSTDGDFIHANIDIDLIIEEAPKHGGYAAKNKPTEIFHIIEHFCLGRRRLHLFGRDSTLRAGWLTVGNELSASNFDARLYASNFAKEPNGLLLGSTEEIERLRPKSPPPRHPNPPNPGGSNVNVNNPSGSSAGAGSSGVPGNDGAGGSTSEQNAHAMGNFPNASAHGMGLTAASALHSISLPTSGVGPTGSSASSSGALSSGPGLHSLLATGMTSRKWLPIRLSQAVLIGHLEIKPDMRARTSWLNTRVSLETN